MSREDSSARATRLRASFDDMSSPYVYTACSSDDIADVYAIERASYPADEAASLESLTMRCAEANEFFMLCRCSSTTAIIGYVCSTLTARETLDHDSMTTHDASGSTLCVHSVVVAPSWRSRGVGKALLGRYCDEWIFGDARLRQRVRVMRLLCKDNLIAFYQTYGGFTLDGESSVVHGAETWFDMHRRASSRIASSRLGAHTSLSAC